MANKSLKKIKNEIKIQFKNEKSGHGIKHLTRVFKYAKIISKNLDCDKEVVYISALVHDVHRLMSYEQNKIVKPHESLERVENILIKCGVNENKLSHILKVVEKHDEKGNSQLDLETKIVQDSDILDAVGKVGLQRTLTYCKINHILISDVSEPLNSNKYVPDYNPISTCHYIYRTMIPQAKKAIYTKEALKLLKNKISILEKFVKKNYK